MPRLPWRDGTLRIWRRTWWALLLGLLWLAEARTVQQTRHDVARGMASSLRAVQHERSAARAEGDQRKQKAVAGKAAMDKAHTEQTRASLHPSKPYDSGASGAQQQRRDRGDARAVVVSAAADSKVWAESSPPAALGRALLGIQAVLRARERIRAGKPTSAAAAQPTTAATAAATGNRRWTSFRSQEHQRLMQRHKRTQLHQPYEDSAHAQQHFLSVVRDIKEKLDRFHGVSTDDAAFGRRWSSCAVVRAPASLAHPCRRHTYTRRRKAERRCTQVVCTYL